MPLDADQYQIRRTYRNRCAVGTKAPKRNENGNLIGEVFTPLQTLGYKTASFTQIDQQFYGDVLNKVSHKIEIPPSKIIQQRQQALTVQMDGQLFNIRQLDSSNYNRWFLYLERITKKGIDNDGK